MLFSVNDFMYSIANFYGTWQMFRYSRNNRIVQDALGHHSFSDSTGIFFIFKKKYTCKNRSLVCYSSLLPEYISFMITDV